MLEGNKRREAIVKLLETKTEPVSGTHLATELGVSRQVIVQDIALLRVTNKNILSTNRGYFLHKNDESQKSKQAIIHVQHGDLDMRDELYAIVDVGAKVLDVIVAHEVYGQITVDLFIKSRKDVDEFMDKILAKTSRPLKILTDNDHYHTIEADSEEILEDVKTDLGKLGMLL
jgi:transcriptional regulator of NAD metabolism